MSVFIVLNHKVLGAPKDVRSDGVLSMTNGVYAGADTFMSQFVGSGIPSTDYASILFFINPETGLHTILHYQPKYIQFPESNRYYDTRVFCELTDGEFVKCRYSYSSLADKLTMMKEYGQRIYDASNVIAVDVPTSITLDSIETDLVLALCDAITNQRQIFLQLGENDKLFGDMVRHSAKLKSILRVFDSMPIEIRKYLSLGYAVENNSNGIRWLSPYLSVVAHCDELSHWDVPSSGITVIDWTKDTPIFPKIIREPSELQKQINECVPMIPDYYGTSIRTFNSFSSLFKNIPSEIDRILNTNMDSVTTEDLAQLTGVFRCGRTAYRHKDVSKHLLIAILCNLQVGAEETEILETYPELREDRMVQDVIINSIRKTSDWDTLVALDSKYGSHENIKIAITEKLTSELGLMDACAANGKQRFSIKYQNDIQRAIKGKSNIVKINRIGVDYYGISPNDLEINSWKEFNKLYGHIIQNGLSEVVLKLLPYNTCWTDELLESTYNNIRNRLSEEDRNNLRVQCISNYFTYPNQHYLLGDGWLTNDEFWGLLESLHNDKIHQRKLIEEYLKHVDPVNYPTDNRLSKYYSLFVPKNECKTLSYLAKIATVLFVGFDSQIIKDIEQTSEIGDKKTFCNALKVLINAKNNRIVDALKKRIEPQINKEIINALRDKDDKGLSIMLDIVKCAELYYAIFSDNNSFLINYETFYGNKKHKKILTKQGFYKMFEDVVKCKANEYIDNIFFSNNKLEKADRLLEDEHINDYPNASKYLILRLTEQDEEKLVALYNIFNAYYGQEDINCGQLKNDYFWKKAVRALIPVWKVLNPKMILLSNIKNNVISNSCNKILFISLLAVLLLTGLVIGIPRNQCQETVTDDTILPPLPATDSLYIHITVGDDDTNSKWQRFPLDSMHPNVIIANTILDTLYIRPINSIISMYCVYYCESKRMVSDTVRVNFTKDNIHSVGRLLPIDSAYRSYLNTSERKVSRVCDTLIYVCGRDTIRVAPGQSLLQQIIGDAKYSTDTVSYVVRGSDTTTLIFGDFIKKNTTRRYLQATDYYLWVIQQISQSNIQYSNK